MDLMKKHSSICLLLLATLALTACPTTDPKKDAAKKAARTAQEHGEETERAADEERDAPAPVEQLGMVVYIDVDTVASMMTPDFAYVLGATPAEDRMGAGVFQYWDENGLWVELDGILSERFVQKEAFMVAPPQFADPTAEYTGYRAGIRRVNGSWKFVYFVNG